IFVVQPDGSGLARLTFKKALASQSPSWSADGKKIAFARFPTSGSSPTGDLWIMDADGSHKVRLTSSNDSDNDPAWSPDGTELVFSRYAASDLSQQDIYTLPSAGGSVTQITSSAKEEYEPTWCPD